MPKANLYYYGQRSYLDQGNVDMVHGSLTLLNTRRVMEELKLGKHLYHHVGTGEWSVQEVVRVPSTSQPIRVIVHLFPLKYHTIIKI